MSIIRPAQPTDIPHLLPLIAKICALHQMWDDAKYGFLPHPEQRYNSWLHQLLRQPRHLCLVAQVSREDSSLVGCLIATTESEIPIYRIKEYGFIHDLWVEPAYRHQGIARQMVQQTIDHFTQLGIAQIRLDTATPNEVARRFFTACGFRPSTTEMLIELEKQGNGEES